MPDRHIEHVGKHDGLEVTLRGWLYNLREAGKLLFPIFPRRHGNDSRRRVAEGSARGV